MLDIFLLHNVANTLMDMSKGFFLVSVCLVNLPKYVVPQCVLFILCFRVAPYDVQPNRGSEFTGGNYLQECVVHIVYG